jgi:serine/threonine protein kinase
MTPEHWKQVKDAFQSLVECPPAERAARLDEVCADDAELRRELELLLASDDQARSFLEVPPVKIPQDPISPLQGQTIGPYRVVSLLGRGGMGEVYQARDSRLGRTVALKILPANVAGDQERMKRFVLEAKAASALSHPSVATIYDIGEKNGITFIAMEYVEGQTLEQRMNGRQMNAIEVRTVARQVAEALEAAHSKGITHRDIKPANLMITTRGEVKVLDFGLAKMSQQAAPGLSAIRTLPGVLMGTVEYMSPEQALGREVDHRTDIFSLGVVLYQMATGRSPFAAISVGETIDRILHSEPEPISRLNPAIPPELERVIRKCLEKERERRYQSARELLADLRERRLATASSRSIRDFILRPKLVIAFGVIGLLAWLATLVLIVAQRLEKPTGSESNHPSQTIARSAVPEVKPSQPAPTSSADDRANQSDRVAPTNESGPTDTNRSSAPAPAPDTTDRVKETQGKTIPAGIESVTPGGSIPTIVDTVYSPSAIAVDAAGNIYIAETDGGRIFKVTTSGTILTIAGTGTPGFSGDGGPATAAQLNSPWGLAVDAAGNVYISDSGNRLIRRVTPSGVITTVAGNGGYGFGGDGDGGPATSAQLLYPRGLAVDSVGKLYISDSIRLRKVSSDGVISTVTAGLPSSPGNNAYSFWGLAVTEAGDVYLADNNRSRVFKVRPNGAISSVAGNGTQGFNGDGGPATSAQLSRPVDVALDSAGNLYIADIGTPRVRKVTPDGVISTFAGGGAGGVNADAGLATSAWVVPYHLATNASGNIYVLQTPGNRQTVLKVTPDGHISTVVAWRGDVLPVRVGQHGVNPARISTAAMLRFDGETTYSQGTPQIIIDNPSSVDATVSFSPVSFNCQFIFEISNAESPTKPELSGRGASPTVRVTGQLKPGLYNLVLRFPGDRPQCLGGTGMRLLLRYVVNVTPQ